MRHRRIMTVAEYYKHWGMPDPFADLVDEGKKMCEDDLPLTLCKEAKTLPALARDKFTEGLSTKDKTFPLEVQEGGDHYKQYAIQPVEFAMSNRLDLCQANVVKYTVRFRDKGGIEDLRKARHYLELLAQFEYDAIL